MMKQENLIKDTPFYHLVKFKVFLFTLLLSTSSAILAESYLDYSLSAFCHLSPEVQYRGSDNGYFFPNKMVGITATSVCVYRDAHGQYFKQGELVKGLKEGGWSQWHENGQKSVEESFKNNKLENLRIRWDKYGKTLSKENFKDGLIEGVSTQWLESGDMIQKHYKNNKLHGQWIKVDNSNHLIEKQEYSNGKKTGIWHYQDKNGNKFSALFRNYKCVSSKLESEGYYTQQSKIIANFTIKDEWICPPIK
jgi:antitoxin component YwqK of YwqJK toxin-antitoxin module